MEDFNFKSGQVIWVKDPDIIYQLDEIVLFSIVFGLDKIRPRREPINFSENRNQWNFRDHILEYNEISKGSPYLFRVNSAF
jgi:hypothetical protein